MRSLLTYLAGQIYARSICLMILQFVFFINILAFRPHQVIGADVIECDALIAPYAWRAFSSHKNVVAKNKVEDYRRKCLGKGFEHASEFIRRFNQAVIDWIMNDRERATQQLIKLSKSGYELADLALALSQRDKGALQALVDRGVHHADIELALNMKATKESARFIIRTLSIRAKTGDHAAALKISLVHLFADIGVQNFKKVDFYLGFAALTNDPSHLYIISRIYSDFPELFDREKAIDALMRSAKLGHNPAIEVLAEVIASGDSATYSFDRAILILCENIEASNIELKKHDKTLSCEEKNIRDLN